MKTKHVVGLFVYLIIFMYKAQAYTDIRIEVSSMSSSSMDISFMPVPGAHSYEYTYYNEFFIGYTFTSSTPGATLLVDPYVTHYVQVRAMDAVPVEIGGGNIIVFSSKTIGGSGPLGSVFEIPPIFKELGCEGDITGKETSRDELVSKLPSGFNIPDPLNISKCCLCNSLRAAFENSKSDKGYAYINFYDIFKYCDINYKDEVDPFRGDDEIITKEEEVDKPEEGKETDPCRYVKPDNQGFSPKPYVPILYEKGRLANLSTIPTTWDIAIVTDISGKQFRIRNDESYMNAESIIVRSGKPAGIYIIQFVSSSSTSFKSVIIY